MTAIQSHTHTLLRNNNGIQIAYRKKRTLSSFFNSRTQIESKQTELTHSLKKTSSKSKYKNGENSETFSKAFKEVAKTRNK